jgi:hypothetical protein
MALSDFFKGKGGYQASGYLLNHPLKDKYFYRLIPFRKLDDRTAVAFDNKSPRLITFDPWPQTIFLSATGLKTIYEFTVEMAKMYKGSVPPGLEQTIIEETEKLVKDNVLAISDQQVFLTKELRYPQNNN